jgi:hypothetical protein
MSKNKVVFSISAKTPLGEDAATEVRVHIASDTKPSTLLETIVKEAKRNIASRSVDFNDFTSDSSYLDALDAEIEKVSVLGINAGECGTHFFCRARVSEFDRRIFVRNINAPSAEAAKILMIWELALIMMKTIPDEDALLDFIDGVELETASTINTATTIDRSYVVSTPAGDDVLVTSARPEKSRMIDDVAEVFILASVIDPTINPEQFTSIAKQGATARYSVEARYNDGDNYSTWVDATDEEEAEFLAACEVEANQTGNADRHVIDDLGDFIDGVDGINVTQCEPDPVTREELLQAVREAVLAYDSRSGLQDAMSKLRDMAQSLAA